MNWFWKRRQEKVSAELRAEAIQCVKDPFQEQWELIAMILEVAQIHEDTDEAGKVFMPNEEEWGLIVGLARKMAKR